MVDNISSIRQLLEESKFVEAQKESEIQIHQNNGSENTELLKLYFQSLLSQNKSIPIELHLSLVDKLIEQSSNEAQDWFLLLQKNKVRDVQKLNLLEMRLAEKRGQTAILCDSISKFLNLRIQTNVPSIPHWVNALIEKYFRHDFRIQSQKLFLDLLKADLQQAETTIKELILSCFETSSLRKVDEKLGLLNGILKSTQYLYHLEVYRHFCVLMVQGISSKQDYKKLLEHVIYEDDFRMQTLLLNLMEKLNLTEVALEYSQVIKKHPDYNFVYFDKYFPQLKKYFFKGKNKVEPVKNEEDQHIDLKITSVAPEYQMEDVQNDLKEDEHLLASVLKYQSFSAEQLLDIGISFFQTELYVAALKASQQALEVSETDEQRLKAYYLKVTCLLKIGDLRAAIDTSLMALDLSKTQNDVLSFMYSQAEAYLRLKEHNQAKKILKKILNIDANYRLAREKMEKLNAI